MPRRPFLLTKPGVYGHKNGVYPRILNTPPTASFTVSKDYGTVTFTDTSVDEESSIASWDWDFGDGATSTAQDPAHTYETDGTYSVTLTVTDEGGLSDSTTTDVTVDVNEPPTAYFTYNKLGDGEVDFTDGSSDPESNIVSYEWAFGDGATSTSQNPTYTYGSDGNYDVTLTVTDSEGLSSSATETISVDVNDAPTAGFSYLNEGGGTYNFSDTSTDDEGNITSWSWDFGDGTTSTAQNPSHTYSSEGVYTVTLTVTDSGGLSDSTSKDLTYEIVWSGTESFESGSWPLPGWQTTNLSSGDVEITTSKAFEGSRSLQIDNGGSNTIGHSGGFTSAIKHTGTASQYSDFSVAYYERSSGVGGVGYWLVDDSGNKVAAVGTTNPQPVWRDGGGEYGIGSASTNNWYTFKITLNWENSTFDVNWNSGSDTIQGRPFINSNASNIAEIHIGCFGSNMNGKLDRVSTDTISTF